ncbi:phenylalanine ammonia-lyase [Puccinia sorghi]|uniref:Phenylalanine ammonia-lyase n=1 Tax=Puccinia sorghi TaxID=27349 RepID=A0A0L6V6Y4_9BASI|nr:phenylalanine ammonia-lyase [Puccinia sorghi]
MQDELECTVLVIVDAFELEKKQIPVVLVEIFISLLAKLIISCLASLRTQSLGHQMFNYLEDVAEGIQGPSIGGMVDRIFYLLQFEHLPSYHPQQFLGSLINIPL